MKHLLNELFPYLNSNSQLTTLSLKLILFILLIQSDALYAQSVLNKIDPYKLSTSVEKRLGRLEEKIITKSKKILQHLQIQEEKIYKEQLATKDSLQARLKLVEIQNKYKALEETLRKSSSLAPSKIRHYIPHLDSLSSALKFLDEISTSPNLKGVLSRIESFNDKLAKAEGIKEFISERKEMLRQRLEQMGLLNHLRRLNKEVYYYSEQIKEYKKMISDPGKIERKAIQLLSEIKPFQDFMFKNSMLASLFRIPGDPDDARYVASLANLQTRVQVNDLIQQQIATGGPNTQAQFRQSIQQAQSQMQHLKNKLAQKSGGGSDDIMPEGFRPNNQKTKSFLKKLEYGTNIQTQRATTFFPTTTDLGLSVGFKLNDKSIIGVGASYKFGLGRGWGEMEWSSQGVGLRSYVDWKVEGSIWISGGYEMNYKSKLRGVRISSFVGRQERGAWQQSGLLGLSKVIDVKSKFFKKTKLQLLWDFLSYQQIPRTQAIIFRIGYNLK